jgi:hypothetical protein
MFQMLRDLELEPNVSLHHFTQPQVGGGDPCGCRGATSMQSHAAVPAQAWHHGNGASGNLSNPYGALQQQHLPLPLPGFSLKPSLAAHNRSITVKCYCLTQLLLSCLSMCAVV